MSDDGWIVVRNWDKFQHYKDRNPPWIKLYTDVGSNEDLTALPLAAQGLLVRIWCDYARANGVLSVAKMRHNIGTSGRSRDFYAHLISLNHAGFIAILASKPLAQREREKEKKSEALTRPKKPVPQTADVKANAGAYKRAEPPPDVEVDEAMLELARSWLNP